MNPTNCDICGTAITDTFIDGRTRMGPWANMCPKCHSEIGCGLGVGNGQHYTKGLDGTFVKIPTTGVLPVSSIPDGNGWDHIDTATPND